MPGVERAGAALAPARLQDDGQARSVDVEVPTGPALPGRFDGSAAAKGALVRASGGSGRLGPGSVPAADSEAAAADQGATQPMTELALFLKHAASRPREVVALAPSSRALAARMAEAVPEGPGNVIELGAGTGRITAALLEAGVPDAAMHCFEINPAFCDHLKRRHPGLNVYRDRAERLGRHGIRDVKAVVSGLPLLSMDEGAQRAIVGAAFWHLRPGGLFIQFTYGAVPPVCRTVREELSLGWTRSGRVWSNVPPATSYVFHRRRAA